MLASAIMRKTLITLLAGMTLLTSAALATPWTHRFEMGEDASSTIYHFYQVKQNGQTTRIRAVWNGGAQNKPTVTDYLLEDGKITIRHSTGERKDIAKLTTGQDAPLKLDEEYTVDDKSTNAPTAKPNINSSQLVDLQNLIYLLSQEREPIKKVAK